MTELDGQLALEFRQWIENRRGISPLYEAICGELIHDGELLQLISQSLVPFVCNKWMAAVHFLLLEGTEHPLRKYYATLADTPNPVATAYFHFRKFCFEHCDQIHYIVRTREVQINEVRRSSVLLAGLQAVAKSRRKPLALIDIGACAGLNLLVDKYFFDYGSAGTSGDPNSIVKLSCSTKGAFVPPVFPQVPEIAWRAGIDVNPVDVRVTTEVNWLIALVSPDDQVRLAFLEAALAIAREEKLQLVKGEAVEVLPMVLSGAPLDLHLCVMHSFTTHHLSEMHQREIEDELIRASRYRDVTRLSLEWDVNQGILQIDSDVPLRLKRYAGGAIATELLLAKADRRGTCDWIRWLAV